MSIQKAAVRLILAMLAVTGPVMAGEMVAEASADWPMWGYDAHRSGASPAVLALPEQLHLQWTRELAPPRRAWPKQRDDFDKLEFDLSYSPVVLDNRLFVSSMTQDRLTAYAADTGDELWRFYADGPARLAPAAWNGRVYFVSDDGHLYCLDVTTGDEIWRFNAAPNDRRVLGNNRVISLWAARGGPVIKDGIVYFAAGVWPWCGTFVYAVDAETGQEVWSNTGFSTDWQRQPHLGAHAFAGIAPQGYLAASGDRLIVSGGRSPPALFNRHTGALIHRQTLQLQRGNKADGGYRVRIVGDHYDNHGTYYALRDGIARRISPVEDPARTELKSRVRAIQAELGDDQVFEAIVAAGGLFITTRSGRLHRFGPEPVRNPPVFSYRPRSPEPADTLSGRLAAEILERTGITDGYALLLGGGDGELIEQLIARSALHVVAIEPDRDRVEAVRRRLDRAGWYGPRAAIIPGDFDTLHYPPYISSLVVVPAPEAVGIRADSATLERLYECLRPYDGRAWLAFDPAESEPQSALRSFNPENGRAEELNGVTLLKSTGPLPGSGDWTHQHGDPSRAAVAADRRVQPPFAPLWYGGFPNDNMPLRGSATAPRPVVSNGRLFVLADETVASRCVFTGRKLWIREFPRVGRALHTFLIVQHMDNPVIATADSIYVRGAGHVHRLDPATGKTIAKWPLPERGSGGPAPPWGHISAVGGKLLITTTPYFCPARRHIDSRRNVGSSQRLAAIDRKTGEVLWTHDAAIAMRHNAIVSGNGMVFVNDLPSRQEVDMAAQRGMLDNLPTPRVMALDIDTGKKLWDVESPVFGNFLRYSVEHDVLVEKGSCPLPEGGGHRMVARNGRDGRTLWTRDRTPPRAYRNVILHGRKIIPVNPGAPFLDLATGSTLNREHPLTATPVSWNYWKSYGCGEAIASPDHLWFRSASAGHGDLGHTGGTGSLGGFRSGCAASLIPADGLLNAPDATRGCTCSYQNQTSLALIHALEMEQWSAHNIGDPDDDAPILRLGINLGAPGGRLAENGTLWVAYPQHAPSVRLNVAIEFEDENERGNWFRKNSLFVDGSDGLNWVAASGLRNVRSITVKGIRGGGHSYRISLHFSEPDRSLPGQRFFDIHMNGRAVAENVDVVHRAGGPDRAFSLTAGNVPIEDELHVTLVPAEGSERPPILSGIELMHRHE